MFDLAMANGARKHYSGVVTADGVIEGSGWHARRKDGLNPAASPGLGERKG